VPTQDREHEGLGFRDFDASIEDCGLFPLSATGLDVLQINFGRLCNQACQHCHVDAGPARLEVIDRESLETCLRILRESGIPTVDITGGAPEMTPHFRWFVAECRNLDRRVMVRSNLTILQEAGQQDLGTFYRDHRCEVIASLPYYTSRVVDAQRGGGVFERSVEAIRQLNRLGYAQEGTGLTLDLVYNPGGAFLPPAQAAIEADFKRELGRRHGIFFNRLLTIANMPIGRFRDLLMRRDLYREYMERLIGTFNPRAASAVMCRTTLSVGWDGSIFDCDFNQMLGLRCDHGAPDHIRDFDLAKLKERRIVTGIHCYGCSAGAGSSCGGAIIPEGENR
jgi:radical SAM/Cys-rich protein